MKPRFTIAFALILIGSNLLTLAFAYRGAVKHTLPLAVTEVERFLAGRQLWWSPDGGETVAIDLTDKESREVRELLEALHGIGGESYAYDDVLPVLGLGGTFIAAGLLVPFYRRGTLAEIDGSPEASDTPSPH